MKENQDQRENVDTSIPANFKVKEIEVTRTTMEAELDGRALLHMGSGSTTSTGKGSTWYFAIAHRAEEWNGCFSANSYSLKVPGKSGRRWDYGTVLVVHFLHL